MFHTHISLLSQTHGAAEGLTETRCWYFCHGGGLRRLRFAHLCPLSFLSSCALEHLRTFDASCTPIYSRSLALLPLISHQTSPTKRGLVYAATAFDACIRERHTSSCDHQRVSQGVTQCYTPVTSVYPVDAAMSCCPHISGHFNPVLRRQVQATNLQGSYGAWMQQYLDCSTLSHGLTLPLYWACTCVNNTGGTICE